ncbi:MAG: ABC transporter substrate-binding protein [Spirochaetales bacterium]|jgi:NitT/TauT family transport system substrate-binding protein
MTSFRSIVRSLLLALLLYPTASLFAQQPVDKIEIAILKGPSGIGSAWMMASPPQVPGVEIQFITASGADIVTAKLISGEFQGGVLPVNVAAKLSNAGVPIKAIAVVGNGMVKFLSSDPAIRTLADIKGKDIPIAGQKATPDYLFRYLAETESLKAGVDYHPLYNLAYPEMAIQLAAGKITCAVLPEPFATQAMMLNKALREPFSLDVLWTEKTGLPSYPMSLFVVSRRLAEQHPDVVEALRQAYDVSIKKTLSDPASTGALAESLDLGMKAIVAQAAIPKSAYVYIVASEARSGVEALLKLFLAFDPQSIGGKLPGADFYANNR